MGGFVSRCNVVAGTHLGMFGPQWGGLHQGAGVFAAALIGLSRRLGNNAISETRFLIVASAPSVKLRGKQRQADCLLSFCPEG